MWTFLAISAVAAFQANQVDTGQTACSNTQIASRVLLEKMGQGRFEISDEIYGPSFIAHGFGRDYSLSEDNASGKQIRTAFPDLKVTILRTAAEGNMVAVHWRSEGTNLVKAGPFPGTGKRARVDGMTFFRFADCRIVEEWTTYDNLGVMQQLGLIPSQ
jgi:predicted ester cyclase